MKYNKFLTLIVPVLVYVLEEIYFLYPQKVYVILVLIFLSFFFLTRQYSLEGGGEEKFYNLMILPTLFTFGLIVFSFYVSSKIFIHFSFVVNLVFLYFYFRTIYYYLIKKEGYITGAMENLSAYGNFLTFFFFSSFFYATQKYLGINIWKLVAFVMIISFLIMYQIVWVNKIDKRIGLFYIFLIGLIIVELAWSISFLTLNFYVLGLLLAINFYILVGLTRFYFMGRFNAKIVKMYLVYGLFSILTVLLSARWI